MTIKENLEFSKTFVPNLSFASLQKDFDDGISLKKHSYQI